MSGDRTASRPDPMPAFAAFAAAAAVGHHLPAVAGGAGDWIDLFTPFAVVATAAVVLVRLGARGLPLVLAVAAAVAYVDGHGIHLAANSIRHEELTGDAEDVAHFWDERFGHLEWHLGWLVLLGAFGLAEPAAPPGRPLDRGLAAGAAAVLGWTVFTSTVEGGSWGLAVAAWPLLGLLAVRGRRPVALAAAAALTVTMVLIAIWAIWQGGVPQFSEVGLL